MKHLLQLAGMRESEAREILRLARVAKKARGKKTLSKGPLTGQIWALIFTKASTRTRVSFEVAIRELGGVPSFLSAAEIQLGRGELVRDTARVMGRMVHGAVIRTFAQGDVEEFAEFAKIPTINALTDDEHPCQILSDIFTIEEKQGSIRGKRVAFIGDAACNVPRSWAEAAKIFDFHLVCGAPKEFQPLAVGEACELDRGSARGGQGGRCPLHRCLGFDGERGGDGGEGESICSLPDQPKVGRLGQEGSPGVALSSGLPGEGDKCSNIRGAGSGYF